MAWHCVPPIIYLEEGSHEKVALMTGFPPFPFAPMIVFWAEREAGVDASEVNSTEWIKRISPRPVFILQGGQDDHISIDSGEKLYEAVGEPKVLWCEERAVHHSRRLDQAPVYSSRPGDR